MDNTKIKDFTPEQFKKLWETIERWERWEEGTIVEVYKISCVRKGETDAIAQYCVDTIGWVTKDECINLAKEGKIDAVICQSPPGNSYLRARTHSSLQKHFKDLAEKS